MSNGLQKVKEKIRYSWTVTGTEIFALLNFIAAFAILLIGLGIILLFITESINHTDRIDSFMWSTCLGINLGVLITFVFSFLLCLGIYQKRTNFLLSYIVFGVVIDITVLSTVVVASQYVSLNASLKEFVKQFGYASMYEPVMNAVIGICVVHILVLSMVSRAWFSIRSVSEDYQKLVDDSIWTSDLSKE